MIRAAAWLMVLLLASVMPCAAETVTAKVQLGDRQMPLPAGEWLLAGVQTQETAHGADGPYGVIRTAVLLQQKGDRVTAIAEFNTNDIALGDGWDTSAACDAAAPDLRVIRYHSRLDSSCAYVTTSRMTGGPPAWEQALEFIDAHHLQLPAVMLTAAFIVSDRQDLIDARLHFDPAGFPATDVAQHKLLGWATRFAPEIEKGMANQLADAPLEGPLRASLLSDTPALDQRLLELERLQQAGAITPAEAQSQEHTAQTEHPRSADTAPGEMETWYYRLSTPVINFVTAYSVTQNPPVALAIAATEQVVHSFVYTANQAAWNHSVSEATRHPVATPSIMHIGDRNRRTGPTS